MTRSSLICFAAAAVLAASLAGCSGPAADTSNPSDDSANSSDDGTGDAVTDDSSDGTFVTLPGSGDYTVGVTAPIGMYELKDSDGQPEGCSWALEDADGKVQFQDQGSTVFITDVSTFFQTSGCPDWVQVQ